MELEKLDELGFNHNAWPSLLWENYLEILEFVVSAVLRIHLLPLQSTLINVLFASLEGMKKFQLKQMTRNFQHRFFNRMDF